MAAGELNQRGRPRVADAGEVAAVALRLFAADGYEATSMESIAKAVGISRATLFRYFSTKSEIVWDRYAAEAVELRRGLDAAGSEGNPLDVLCDILPRLLHYPEAERDLLRVQVTLIASVPAIQGHAASKTSEWIAIMAEYVARRTGTEPGDLLPQVLSQCVWSAGWTALTHWAASDDPTPDDALALSFAALRAGFSLEALGG